MTQQSIFDKTKAVLREAIAQIRTTLPQPYESEIEAVLAGLILKDIPAFEDDYLKRRENE